MARKSRKKRSSSRRRGRRSIGAASRACKGLGKRKRKACMSRYMRGGKKRGRRR